MNGGGTGIEIKRDGNVLKNLINAGGRGGGGLGDFLENLVNGEGGV